MTGIICQSTDLVLSSLLPLDVAFNVHFKPEFFSCFLFATA